MIYLSDEQIVQEALKWTRHHIYRSLNQDEITYDKDSDFFKNNIELESKKLLKALILGYDDRKLTIRLPKINGKQKEYQLKIDLSELKNLLHDNDIVIEGNKELIENKSPVFLSKEVINTYAYKWLQKERKKDQIFMWATFILSSLITLFFLFVGSFSITAGTGYIYRYFFDVYEYLNVLYGIMGSIIFIFSFYIIFKGITNSFLNKYLKFGAELFDLD